MKSFKKFLHEVFISPRKGAKYGQVIFLVGGAATGKSTAVRRFIDSSSYKVINPDNVKELISKAAKKGYPAFASMKGVDPDTPEGSQQLHQFILQTKLSSKKAKLLTKGAGRSVLPNLLFDRTFSWAGEFKKISRNLIKSGYKAENIHVVFVFTDVNLALKRNLERARTLPDEVIVSTNKGARARFVELFFGRAKGAVANGDYYIIINRGDRVVKVKSAGKRVDRGGMIAAKVASMLT